MKIIYRVTAIARGMAVDRAGLLAIEIALALLIKIVILTLLWHAFFSSPQTKKMRMPTPQVEQHLLTPAATLTATQPFSSSTPKARDATHR